ncbi:MAG: asparaginase domain-containing protein [Campylobacterota bacterium]|nr:asparaginase domain-containing protein [Campylobacterota bacterium]
MNNKKNILILNTGGTFSKVYNELTGELIVPKNNDAVNTIIKYSKLSKVLVDGLIYKDSLKMNNNDRDKLVEYINNSDFEKIIIIHGTDTISITASYLNRKIKNKRIILTGSMIPFSINPIEATANLMMAYGFINNCKKNNIYICMHGLIKKHTKINKNRELGVFQ